MLDNKNFFN
jgi:phage-related minor tail protein